MDFVSMDSALRAVLFGGIFLVSLLATLWLFYDAQERRQGVLSSEALLALEALAILGTALTLPALIISAFNLDVSQQDVVNPLSYLGLGGIAVTVVVVATYAVFSRQKAEEPVTVKDEEPTPPPQIEPPTETVRSWEEEEKTKEVRLQPQEMAYLVLKSGLRAGTIYRLGQRTLIGRPSEEKSPDIALDDNEVSRGEHASIRLEEGRFVLKDLDSTNGTWLLTDSGRTKVEAPHALKDGDRIQLGSTVLVFVNVRRREDQPA